MRANVLLLHCNVTVTIKRSQEFISIANEVYWSYVRKKKTNDKNKNNLDKQKYEKLAYKCE